MTETRHLHHGSNGQARSAVGQLTMIVEVVDGTEKVTYERRVPDAASARLWCEEKVGQAPAGTAVLEIKVTEEFWGRRHPWEATARRHIPETLQLGVRTRTGTVAWGVPHQVASDLGARRD